MGIVSCTSKANKHKPTRLAPSKCVSQYEQKLLQQDNQQQQQQQQQLMTKSHQQFLKRLVLSYCHAYVTHIILPTDLVNICSKFLDGFLCKPLNVLSNTIKELEAPIQKWKPRQYSSILIQKGGALTVKRYEHLYNHHLIILCYGDIILEENAKIHLNGKGSKYGNGDRKLCGVGGGTLIIKCYGTITLKQGALISCDGTNAGNKNPDSLELRYGGGGPGGYIYIEVNEPSSLQMCDNDISCSGASGWESFCGGYVNIKKFAHNGTAKVHYLNERN